MQPPENPQVSPDELTQSGAHQPALPTKTRIHRLISWLVIISGGLFWVPFGLLVAAYSIAINAANHGASGTEFIGILLVPVYWVVACLGVVYAALLLVQLRIQPLSSKRRVVSLISLAFLIGLYGWQAYVNAQAQREVQQNEKTTNTPLSTQEVIALVDACKLSSIQKDGDEVRLLYVSSAYYDAKGQYVYLPLKADARDWDSIVDEVNRRKSQCDVVALDMQAGPSVSWVSVSEATKLLQDCEIKTFNYTPSGLGGLSSGVPAGTSTGIIYEKYPTFAHMFIEPEAEATMIPAARSVQKHCNGPQFYHDGHYEQPQPDGTWK